MKATTVQTVLTTVGRLLPGDQFGADDSTVELIRIDDGSPFVARNHGKVYALDRMGVVNEYEPLDPAYILQVTS